MGTSLASHFLLLSNPLTVQLAKKLAKEGKILIVSPDDTCGVDTLTRDENLLKKLYDKGYNNAKRIKEFIG